MLPVLVVGLAWLFAWRRGAVLGFRALTRRGALVVAFALWQLVTVAITEVLSRGGHLTSAWVAAAWGVVVVALVVVLRHEFRPAWAMVRRAWEVRRTVRATLPLDAVLGGAVVAVYFAIFSFLAWVYPPSNGDSMVYHLARVEHWLQAGSVATFPTHYLAQVELAPLHGYDLAHLHLLAGTDRLDGYVQLFAALVCVLGASELARRLGLHARGQVFAALLCVSAPSLVLEATSTQNNVFAAAVGVALIVVLTAEYSGEWGRRALAIGCVGALAVLTKGTLIALLGPVVLLLALMLLRAEVVRHGLRRTLGRAAVGGLIAVAAAGVVAGPFLGRNYEMFGSPSGPVSAGTISTELTVRAALGNIIRSTAGEFASGSGPVAFPPPVSRALLDVFRGAYNRLDVDPTDWHYVLGTKSDAFEITYNIRSERTEQYGANPFQTLLVIVTLGMLAFAALVHGRRELRRALLFAAALSLGYLAFTATARWSVFAVRYYIPLLVLWCPLIAVAFSRLPRAVNRATAAVVVVAGLPALLDNTTRSVLHPTFPYSSTLAPYFEARYALGEQRADRSARTRSYESLTRTIAASTCQEVGIANWILVEYPIWVGLRKAGWRGSIQAVDVTNESGRYADPDFKPCALIRQESPGHVPPASGMVHFQFGVLALAMAPETLPLGAVSAAGFVSRSPGLAVLPGSGWALTGEGPRSLIGSATLYLTAGRPGSAEVTLTVADPTSEPAVRSPGADVRSTPGRVVLRVPVRAGINAVRLAPASSGVGGLAVSEVSVSAS